MAVVSPGMMQRLVINIIGEASSFTTMMDRVEASAANAMAGVISHAQAASQQLTLMGRHMTIALSAPLTLIGGLAVAEFGRFDKAFARSMSIMDGLTTELEAQAEATARSLSMVSSWSPTQLAEGYLHLASAGFDAATSIEALAVVERFATAGAFDLSMATTLLADSVAAFGIKGKTATETMESMLYMSNALTRAEAIANASTEEFAIALTHKAAAAARHVNMSLEDTIAVLAVFAEQGIKGSLAGERFDIVVRDLQRAVTANRGAWEAMNIQVYDAAGAFRGVGPILRDLDKRWAGWSHQVRRSAVEMLGFQDRSFAALQALLGMGDSLDSMSRKMQNLEGNTDAVAAKVEDNFVDAMTRAWNVVRNAASEIGEVLAPAVQLITRMLAGTVKAWAALPYPIKLATVAIGGFVAALGPMLLLQGMWIRFVPLIVTELSSLTNSLYVGASAWTAFWAAATFGIALVIPAIVGLVKHWDDLVAKMESWGFGPIFDELAAAWQQIKDAVAPALQAAMLEIRTIMQAVGDTVSTGLLPAIRELIGLMAGAVAAAIKKATQFLIEHKQVIIDFVNGAARLLTGAIRLIITGFEMASIALREFLILVDRVRNIRIDFDRFGTPRIRLGDDDTSRARREVAELAQEYERLQQQAAQAATAAAQAADNMATPEQIEAAKKIREEYERVSDTFYKQQETMGMTARQVQIWEAAQKGVTGAELEHLRVMDRALTFKEQMAELQKQAVRDAEAAREKQEQITQRHDDYIDGLRDQLVLFGLEGRALEIRRAALDGATQAQLREMQILDARLTKKEKEAELEEKARKLMEDHIPLAQKLTAQYKELKAMKDKGLISQQVFNKEVDKLKQKWAESKIVSDMKQIEATAYRTADAFHKMFDYMETVSRSQTLKNVIAAQNKSKITVQQKGDKKQDKQGKHVDMTLGKIAENTGQLKKIKVIAVMPSNVWGPAVAQ